MSGNGTRVSGGRAAVVELVGPAGAGKSTLARLLHERHASLSGLCGLWTLPRPRLHLTSLRRLPRVLTFYRAYPRPVWEELKQIIRLDTLYRVVEREKMERPRAVLLDEGPVFALGWFQVHGDDRLHRSGFATWRQRSIARWSRMLDIVVVLDAPDAALAQRIRTREKWHRVKHMSDDQIFAFLAMYRAALAQAVAALNAIGGLRVLNFCTATESAERAADRLHAALQERLHG
jgi:thymidylate kinase